MIIRYERNGKVKHGWMVESENKVRVIEGDIYKVKAAKPIMTGLELPLDEIVLKTPCTPSKVVSIGLNYRDRAEEMGIQPAAEPAIAVKPSVQLAGPDESLVFPGRPYSLQFGGGLAVVIKKEARHITAEEADEYILGFTCAIDVAGVQQHGGQQTKPGETDSICALGPAIAAKLDYADLRIVTRVNGEVRQDSSTKQMIFSIPRLLEAVSSVVTLLPGDVMLTGTPAGASELHPGDEISVTVEGIGTLTTRVSVGMD
ncbi:2-keto-4-pentenoate hydratase/2-oxohepta-3-ene-1,7-dioic acid hydratase in catechol pathway [Brevibacillus aydinogluensis]|jgi:2-keto-4-pentenoate hydratase/2-oxohepta-3-ene-1,7-dioic acid hydratase in catechol pathway|uniref:fumarylacetoacetate hydrolase family protein n=1 Tax=Brevibacillus TaxID=55080 RepID=UPI001B922C6C|nr:MULTISPECIES: fumarylacetoacetate hydrolase family protein [Brevibacillus]MBR8660872.1 fumarylacetoacetate hydrolase family protein [Brevibacillus sp. NL20B1]MDT3416899.1 2-keto-4-pentenoate hydratase/2-oxohepta-3-ene-1,7-dioic acid hydratase in catechol pathway [Brevibacillus aydinogluensis]